MTTKNNNRGKNNRAVRAENLSAGTKKHYPNGSTQLTVGNVPYTVDQIDANLQEVVSLRTATTDAQVSAKARVAAEKAKLPALLAFMTAYVAYVKATFGETPDVLADFGLVPKKAFKPLSPEDAAAAKAKREATRKARGTVGPVKKLGIVGNVVGVKITPITAPEASASPSPQPAAAPAASNASTPVTTTAGASAASNGSSPAGGGGSPAPHS